ncbi:MAG: zinc metallopeptidase [Aureispira sp.]|nr:zinc metallopeptidase [Aureispira sp.]
MELIFAILDLIQNFSSGELFTISAIALTSLLAGMYTHRSLRALDGEDLKIKHTGKSVAEDMLWEYGLGNIDIKPIKGQLTDNYNPKERTINLSKTTYNRKTALAVAIAAHEAGHVVQHEKGNVWWSVRTALAPIVKWIGRLQMLAAGAFILLHGLTNSPIFLWAMLIWYLIPVVFTIILLPFEFDASAKALRWIKEFDILKGKDYKTAEKALNLAATTYVWQAISTGTVFFRWLIILRKRR